jgi:hypothetical protein
LHRIPGPSALLYYQNTDIRGFVATISAKIFESREKTVVNSQEVRRGRRWAAGATRKAARRNKNAVTFDRVNDNQMLSTDY